MSQPPRSNDGYPATAEKGVTRPAMSLTCAAPLAILPAPSLEGETYRDHVGCKADLDSNDDGSRGDYNVNARDDSDSDDVEDGDYASASSLRAHAYNTASSKDGLCLFRSPTNRGPPVQYDPHDHTRPDLTHAPSSSLSAKVQQRRLWVLPRDAFHPQCWASLTSTRSSLDTAAKSCSDGEAYASNGRSGACASTHGLVAPAAPVTTGDPHALPPSALQPDSSAVGAAPLALNCMINASVARLPHPRHGQPLLCLVVRDPTIPVVTRTFPPNLPSAVSASPSLLYEVQAHAPPSGFAQSWFVKEQVVPSTVGAGELLVATPLDLTFFALYELLGDAQRYERLSRTFMSAEDLYRDRDLRPSAVTSASAAGYEGDAPETNAFLAVFSGVGGGGEDSRSSTSSSAPCTAALLSSSGAHDASVDDGGPHGWAAHPPSQLTTSSFFSATPHGKLGGGSGRGWAGWARAAAAHPLLLHHCLRVLQSDGVLRRLCEVRVIGGNSYVQTSTSDAPVESLDAVYYRPSESVAVEWLKTRVERVRASPVLRAILQLPESSPVATTTAAAPAEACVEVPMTVAFGVVAEYVPDRLHAALAAACGLPDPAATPVSSPIAAASTDGAKRHRDDVATNRRKAEATPSAAGTKSASVKRLEKAGKPKGTPTLLEMFAKKARSEGAAP
nr:unnamed protein product [Leishmania braziliensis]